MLCAGGRPNRAGWASGPTQAPSARVPGGLVTRLVTFPRPPFLAPLPSCATLLASLLSLGPSLLLLPSCSRFLLPFVLFYQLTCALFVPTALLSLCI